MISPNISWNVWTETHCRNNVYDASIGNCLDALHPYCADDVVRYTASELISVFPLSVFRTRSPELKVSNLSWQAWLFSAGTCICLHLPVDEVKKKKFKEHLII